MHEQTGSAQQVNTARRARLHLFPIMLMLIGVVAYFPTQGKADTAVNDQFELYIFNICNTGAPPPGWDLVKLGQLCAIAFTGGPAGGGPGSTSSSNNLGTGDASSTAASSKTKEVHECLDDLKSKPGKKACAVGGWGMLLSSQYGRNRRPETELENGFKSDLKGLLVGLDYRFSDSFILGAAVGHTQDEASFINNAGSLASKNSTFTLYSTWLPAQKIALDGYLGYGALTHDSRRRVVFGPIVGELREPQFEQGRYAEDRNQHRRSGDHDKAQHGD